MTKPYNNNTRNETQRNKGNISILGQKMRLNIKRAQQDNVSLALAFSESESF